MIKNVIIQGLGCAESGARVVLCELVRNAPPGPRFWVLCTAGTARELIGRLCGRTMGNVFVIGLSHAVFGRWLRLVVETVVALAGVTRLAAQVVNLSHYGLCLGGRFTLYMHSPLLMDARALRGWKNGHPNAIKRKLLDTCLRRADVVVLQTPEMALQLCNYCAALAIHPPRLRVLRPRLEIPVVGEIGRRYRKQLFYPTSRFAHKRAALAVAGTSCAGARNPAIGLVLTATSESTAELPLNVTYLGAVSRTEIFAWLRNSDAMLFTSERETLGLPLLEALQVGLPVIAPRLPYSVEILADAGVYFDDPTPDGVADAIERCLADLSGYRKLTARRAQQIAAESATWRDHWKVLLEGVPSAEEESPQPSGA